MRRNTRGNCARWAPPRAIAGYCQFGRAELAAEVEDTWDDTLVASLLFADVQGFTQLSDPEISLFVEQFLGRVAKLVRPHAKAIMVRETWGDGLFFALNSVQVAGNLALALSGLASGITWQSRGFSRPLPLRIALHVGPVHLGTNPLTGLACCSGAHVSRAARLEPKTPPGQVYASEAFAVLAKMEQVEGFECLYVKQLCWAKQSGTCPTYVVRKSEHRQPRVTADRKLLEFG